MNLFTISDNKNDLFSKQNLMFDFSDDIYKNIDGIFEEIQFIKESATKHSGTFALFHGLIFETESLLKNPIKLKNFLLLFRSDIDIFHNNVITPFIKINPPTHFVKDLKEKYLNSYSGSQIETDSYTPDLYFNLSLNNFINNIIELQKTDHRANRVINSFFIILAENGIMSPEKRIHSYHKIAEEFNLDFNSDALKNLMNNKPFEFNFINIIQKNEFFKANNYFDLMNTYIYEPDIYKFNLFVNYLAINLKSLANEKGYLKVYKDYIVKTDNIDTDNLNKLQNITLSYFRKSIFLQNNQQYTIPDKDIEYISYFDYLVKILPSEIPSIYETPNNYISEYMLFLKSVLEEHYLKKEVLINNEDHGDIKKRI